MAKKQKKLLKIKNNCCLNKVLFQNRSLKNILILEHFQNCAFKGATLFHKNWVHLDKFVSSSLTKLPINLLY